VRSTDPKKVSSDTTALRVVLRAGREAVLVEGGQEEGRRSTRSSAHASQDVGGERAEVAWGAERGGAPLFLYDTVIVLGEERQTCTGQRV
jgi:hypothetical protein